MPDGTYTLSVIATALNGRISSPAISTYVLDRTPPPAPTLDYDSGSAGTDRSPYWAFTLPAGTSGRCDLLYGGAVVASQTCRGAVSFSINGAPGTYTLRVVATDGAGNQSRALLVNYVLQGGGGGGGIGGSGGSGGGTGGSSGGIDGPTPTSTRLPTQNEVSQIVNQLVRAAGSPTSTLRRATGSVAAITPGLPLIHDPLTNDVSHAVQHVFNAVSKAGGGTGFPLLLLVVVFVFLMVQSRIDRRDPKLAFASVAADDNLQFGPPPSRGGLNFNGPGSGGGR